MLIETTAYSLNYHFLRNLIRYENVLKLNTGAEIGVLNGDTSFYLLVEIPELKLHSVDPYLIYGDYTGEYTQEKLSQAEQKARMRLKVFGDRSNLIKKFSTEAALDFKNESLDFVFIDGAHDYKSVKDDIAAWYPKLRDGGLFSGHDYRWEGVRKAVDEFSAESGIHGFFSPISSDVWFFRKP